MIFRKPKNTQSTGESQEDSSFRLTESSAAGDSVDDTTARADNQHETSAVQPQHATTDAISLPNQSEQDNGTDETSHQPTGTIVLELDKVMVDRHMSLKELADEVGISNVNLSKIKNNRVAAIRFTTLAGICEALECQPGDILKYEPKQPT